MATLYYFSHNITMNVHFIFMLFEPSGANPRGMGVYIPPIIRAHFPQKIEFSPSKNYSHILNFLSQIILLARSEYYYVYLFLISNLVLHQPWVFIYDHHYY